jgi:hypothetical protein
VVAKELAKAGREGSPRLRSNSRTGDAAPWYGGDELDHYLVDGDEWVCTSGFEFGSGSMSTAGHCGPDPTSFYNNGAFVGQTLTVQFGNGRIDMQRINGSGGVAIGAYYCTDGYVTGQNCTAEVYAIDECVELYDDYLGEYVDECDQDMAESCNLTTITLPGDSGGPVYTNTSYDDPYAVGTITGEASDGAVAYWSDMYEEKVIFHLTPEVG